MPDKAAVEMKSDLEAVPKTAEGLFGPLLTAKQRAKAEKKAVADALGQKVHALVAVWCQKYRKYFHQPYKVLPWDLVTLKGIANSVTPEDFSSAANGYFQDTDPFIGRNGFSLDLFMKRFNKYQRVHTDKKQGTPTSMLNGDNYVIPNTDAVPKAEESIYDLHKPARHTAGYSAPGAASPDRPTGNDTGRPAGLGTGTDTGLGPVADDGSRVPY